MALYGRPASNVRAKRVAFRLRKGTLTSVVRPAAVSKDSDHAVPFQSEGDGG